MTTKKNNRCHFLFIIFILGFSQLGISQSSIYKGSFKNGNVTYEYFENEDYERVYSGTFQYKGTTLFGGVITMSGDYTNGKMEGKWVFSNNDIIYQGAFSNGLLNGEWIKKNNKTGKIISRANFSDGKFKGTFLYEEKDFKLSATFDDRGRLSGELRILYTDKDEPYEDIQLYSSGILTFRLHRNKATGEIIEKIDNKDFVAKFLKESDSTAIIDSVHYVVIDYGSNDLYWPSELEKERKKFSGLNHERGAFVATLGTWLYNQEIGFKEFYEGTFTLGEKEKILKNSRISKIIIDYSKTSLGKDQAFRQKLFMGERNKTLNSMQKIKNDLDNQKLKSSTSIDNALYNINAVLEKLKKPKYEENKDEFIQKFELANQLYDQIFEQKAIYEKELKFKSFVSKGNSYWEEAINTKRNRNYYSEDDRYVKEIKPDISKALENYRSAYELIQDESVLQKIQEVEKELTVITELETQVLTKNSIRNLEYKVKNGHQELQKNYTEVSAIGSLAFGTETTKMKKRSLFKAYTDIYNYAISDEDDSKKKLNNLEQLASVQEKMKKLADIDTKELEKSVKKIDIIQDKIDIILNY